jgi:hypothetical protein
MREIGKPSDFSDFPDFPECPEIARRMNISPPVKQIIKIIKIINQ